MKVYKKNDDLVYTITGDETVIMIPWSGDFFELNRTGTIIFKLIDGKRSVTELLTKASKELKIDESILKKDIKEFLSNLVKKKILL